MFDLEDIQTMQRLVAHIVKQGYVWDDIHYDTRGSLGFSRGESGEDPYYRHITVQAGGVYSDDEESGEFDNITVGQLQDLMHLLS